MAGQPFLSFRCFPVGCTGQVSIQYSTLGMSNTHRCWYIWKPWWHTDYVRDLPAQEISLFCLTHLAVFANVLQKRRNSRYYNLSAVKNQFWRDKLDQVSTLCIPVWALKMYKSKVGTALLTNEFRHNFKKQKSERALPNDLHSQCCPLTWHWFRAEKAGRRGKDYPKVNWGFNQINPNNFSHSLASEEFTWTSLQYATVAGVSSSFSSLKLWSPPATSCGHPGKPVLVPSPGAGRQPVLGRLLAKTNGRQTLIPPSCSLPPHPIFWHKKGLPMQLTARIPWILWEEAQTQNRFLVLKTV